MPVEESVKEAIFGKKWQAYSLTFSLQMAVFWELFYLRCQLKKVEKRRFFGKNGKPIALLFSLKMAVFGCPFICGAS